MYTYNGTEKIDPSVDSTHIDLTCKHHPELRWYTKNMGYIGARSIFFDCKPGEWDTECSCPSSDLIVAPTQSGE